MLINLTTRYASYLEVLSCDPAFHSRLDMTDWLLTAVLNSMALLIVWKG